MRVLREWLSRLWATVRPTRRDEDLEEELRLHLELVAEQAARRGHDPEEARRLARLEAGGRAQALEAMRDQRGLPWLEDLARDAAYGWRTLLRRPGFAATAMLSLALGIGANTGIFSLVDQLLLRVLPIREPDRLVLLDWRGPSLPSVQNGDQSLMSYPLCLELAEQRQYFEGVVCRSPGVVNLSTGGAYELARSEIVSGRYFEVLGVRPSLGRLIGPSDDVRPGAHPVVVVSHDYWQNNLGAAPDVVGRPVLVNKHPMTIIGVAAEGFRGLDVAATSEVWIPAMMVREATIDFDRVLDRRAFWMNAFARLQSGVSPADAERGIQPWFASMLQSETRREGFPPVTPEVLRAYLASRLELLPAAHGFSTVRGTIARPMWALLAGTALLLLLACLNVASLLLARGAERAQELTTRMALGASRGRLTRQLMAESVLIALVGGLIGLLAAPAVSRLMLLFLPDGTSLTPGVDPRIFLFAFLITVVAGVLCGVAPAFQASRRPLASSINGRATPAEAGVRLRKLIVGAQLALTLVLLAGAGLFVQTLASLYTRERGFDSDRLVMFRADAAGAGSTAADPGRVMRDLMESLQQVPAVERVSIGNIPLLGTSLGPSRVLTLDTVPRTVLERSLPMMRIGAGFFTTVGTRILDGREFDERDVLALDKNGVRAIIVNESFARRFFDGASPVGRRVALSNLPNAPLDVEIVGLVSDFRRRFLRDDYQPEHIFVPFAQTGVAAGDGTVFVRVRGEPAAAFTSIRAAVARVDSRLPLVDLRTAEDQITRALRREVMLATLSSGFGSVALLLSVVGLFGVMSFVVTQRTQEVGLRMALGATRASAVWLIVRDALVTIGAGAAAGIIVGVAAGVLAAEWLSIILYGISPSDVVTFAGTTVGLAAVSLAACIVPAGRAAMLSPMVAMREQTESMWRTAGRRVRLAVREIASSSDRSAATSATLVTEIGGAIHRADSFPDAVAIALATLRERVGATFVLLLEKTGNEYSSAECMIPADGILVSRLRHYPHPLPLTATDFEVWARWATELRPAHAAEIDQLARSGTRMAVPLRTTHELVGILLLGPPVAREEFTAADREVLSSAADVFALLIENGRLSARALEQEKLRRDVALAAEVQRRLLPRRPPACASAAFSAFTLPARHVGGDYYDFLELGDDRIGLAIADIAGKGIPAALLMSAVQASLRVIAARDMPSSALATQMNRQLYQSTATNSYATFFYAQLDLANRHLCYVNAGHNPPYLVRRTASDIEITELSAGGMVIGLFPDAAYEDGYLELQSGDLLVAFTDGVTEARSASGEEFGEEQLKDLLRGAVGMEPDAIAATLAERIRAWMTGAEQHDDVTFVITAIR
jgi:predicted permease